MRFRAPANIVRRARVVVVAVVAVVAVLAPAVRAMVDCRLRGHKFQRCTSVWSPKVLHDAGGEPGPP